MLKIITKSLPIPLTNDEKIALGQSNAREVEALYELRMKAKVSAAAHKKLIEDQESKISALSHIVAAGIEWRDIDCEERMDYGKGHVHIVRCDTGAEIEVRRMNRKEQQLALDEVV